MTIRHYLILVEIREVQESTAMPLGISSSFKWLEVVVDDMYIEYNRPIAVFTTIKDYTLPPRNSDPTLGAAAVVISSASPSRSLLGVWKTL